jgi:uncharacterized protein YggE
MMKGPALVAAFLVALVLAGNPAGAAPASPLPGPAPGGAAPTFPGQAIVVTGRGVAEATPDRGLVTIGAQITRPTAQEAQERVSATMNQVLSKVTALGIPRERIQTVEINLFPQHRPSSGEITGYQAVQRVVVTVDDLALVGRILDAAVTAGANLLDGVSFTLRDPAVYRTRAFATAVQDARVTAMALAAAAGVTISRVVRIEELGATVPSVRGAALQATPDTTAPVLPGTLTVTVQVRAVFAF